MDVTALRAVTRARIDGFRCKNVPIRVGPGIICRRGNRIARYLGYPPTG